MAIPFGKYHKRNKYLAKKVSIDGMTFDSIKEGAWYRALKQRQENGEIDTLEVHPKFVFPCGLKYTADFRFYDTKQKKQIVVDVKSEITKKLRDYRMRVTMLKYHQPEINFEEW